MPEKSIKQRRALVRELSRRGQTVSFIAETLPQMGIVNPRTKLPYSQATVKSDLAVVSEMIGRDSVAVDPLWRVYAKQSIDRTRTDYRFWDQLRRGMALGFELGGLFCQPIVQIIASFVLGKGVDITVADEEGDNEDAVSYTNDLLSRWLHSDMATLMRVTEDTYALADQYVIVNPDGSLSIPSPETVKRIDNPLDYRTPLGYCVTTTFEGTTITDEYYADKRVLTVKNPKINAGKPMIETYENLIGIVPVVHFANDRSANEVYGRPIYEALFRLFSRYDDLFEKALDGAELMGNPIPTFEGLDSVEETQRANASATETYMDVDGLEKERPTIAWDRVPALFLAGGTFKYSAPNNGFTEDIRNMLKSLFLLMMDFCRVPEFMWGGAIASSKASAEVQLPPFLQYIEGRRLQLEGSGADMILGRQSNGGLLQLADIWLKMRSLTDKRVLLRPTRAQWQSLTELAEQIKLEYLKWARTEERLITAETALRASAGILGVENPEAESEAVKDEEREARENDPSLQIQRLANTPDEPEEDPEIEEDEQEPAIA